VAHIYPRLAPTCEWDTAAAHAIVEEAGGVVLQAGLCDSKGQLLEDWKVRKAHSNDSPSACGHWYVTTNEVACSPAFHCAGGAGRAAAPAVQQGERP
jgi:hypothetical protein